MLPSPARALKLFASLDRLVSHLSAKTLIVHYFTVEVTELTVRKYMSESVDARDGYKKKQQREKLQAK